MRKMLSKIASVSAAASLALVAPTFVPVLPTTTASAFVVCGVAQNATYGSAYAAPLPCPVGAGHIGVRPWPVVAIFAGVAGVMLNAAYVWNTQCRELTLNEAMTSTFLPGVGMAFNGNASKCRR